jgi:hypothetical protein
VPRAGRAGLSDPPPGGWSYELSSTANCLQNFPVQDFWPFYWDEYFSPCGSAETYMANPNDPEYLTYYRQGNTLLTMGTLGVSPNVSLGFQFSDRPSTNFIVSGTGNPQTDSFVTALVGVIGSCNVLVSSNCAFQIFPGSTFKWTSTNGNLVFTATPGGSPLAGTQGNVQTSSEKDPDPFPVNPTDLTGAQLSQSAISVDQFLSLSGLTQQSLAALGGGISIFSATLTPNQAAALAAVTAGATLVPPSDVATTASGLAYSRVSQTFNGTVTLTNIGTSPISGPFQILLTSLTGGVTLANGTGNLSGVPYVTVSAVTSLAAGQSVTVAVQFKNPSFGTINFTPQIYSGSI